MLKTSFKSTFSLDKHPSVADSEFGSRFQRFKEMESYMPDLPREPHILLLYIGALVITAVELFKFIKYIWRK